MPTFDIGTFLAGLFSLVGGTLSTKKTNETNLQMTQDTNETNKQIAQETNETNERIADKANEFNKEQSELAYQRSTASNQVAELMKAGLSEQQALQIISNGGASASMTPATASPIPATYSEMQAGQVTNEGFMQGLNGFTSAISASFDNPTGGAFGAIQGNPVINDLQEFDIDWSKVGSINDLKNYAKELKDGHPLKKYVESQKFKSASRFLPSRRFIENEFRTSMQSLSFKSQLEQSKQEMRLKFAQTQTEEAHKKLVEAEELTEQERKNGIVKQNSMLQYNLEQMEFEKRMREKYGEEIAKFEFENLQFNHDILGKQAEKAKALTDLEINAMTKNLEKAIEQMTLDLKGIKDPHYQELYLSNMLQEQELRAAVLTGQLYQQAVEQAFNDTVSPQMSALVHMFGGFMSTLGSFGGGSLVKQVLGLFFK